MPAARAHGIASTSADQPEAKPRSRSVRDVGALKCYMDTIERAVNWLKKFYVPWSICSLLLSALGICFISLGILRVGDCPAIPTLPLCLPSYERFKAWALRIYALYLIFCGLYDLIFGLICVLSIILDRLSAQTKKQEVACKARNISIRLMIARSGIGAFWFIYLLVVNDDGYCDKLVWMTVLVLGVVHTLVLVCMLLFLFSFTILLLYSLGTRPSRSPHHQPGLPPSPSSSPVQFRQPQVHHDSPPPSYRVAPATRPGIDIEEVPTEPSPA